MSGGNSLERGIKRKKYNILLKVNEYTFRGSNSVISLLPTYKLGSSRKGKNLLPSEQILSFKCGPHFERTSSLGKQTGSHKKCLS